MAVRIRLQRHGRTKRPFYHIVVADSRSPRDGRFIEKLGTYDPMTKPATIIIDDKSAIEWLDRGAQPSDTANAILRYKGVLHYRHLLIGVRKGAITQEVADERYAKWLKEKETNIIKAVEKTVEERKAQQDFIFGKPKARKVEAAPVVEETYEAAPVVEEVVEAAPVVEEVVEAAPVVEEVVEAAPVVEEVVEAAPVVEEVVEAAPVVEEVVEAAPVVEEATEVINLGDQDPELLAADEKPAAE